jgi:hypothetical protein
MNKFKRYATLIVFLITLETIIFVTSHVIKSIDWMVLLALPFASSMAARAIAYLDIFEWLRHPFTKVTPHSSGVGNSVNAIGGPIRSVIGGLLCCVNCAGMWSTVLLMAVYAIDPPVGKIMILCLGAAAIGVLVTRTIEMVEWNANLAQEKTGELNRKNHPMYSFTLNNETPVATPVENEVENSL